MKYVYMINLISKIFKGTICLLGITTVVCAQPSTEVMLAHLDLKSGSVTNLVNISQNQGYDNQPFFIPQGVLFSAQNGAQTEVMLYHFTDQKLQRITQTSGSEYSPTLMPDSAHFSAILLEADGTQLLWKYSLDGSDASVLVPDLKIGYHCYLADHLMAAFVLGEPHKLFLIDLSKQEHSVIAENIGRALHKIPGSHLLSYVDKTSEPWTIKSYDWKTQTTTTLTNCLAGSEDLTWTPHGMLMAQDAQLFKWTEKGDWSLLADLSELNVKGITRLAVNSKGDKIALVVQE